MATIILDYFVSQNIFPLKLHILCRYFMIKTETILIKFMYEFFFRMPLIYETIQILLYCYLVKIPIFLSVY